MIPWVAEREAWGCKALTVVGLLIPGWGWKCCPVEVFVRKRMEVDGSRS